MYDTACSGENMTSEKLIKLVESEILVCPVSLEPLFFDAQISRLWNRSKSLNYEVLNKTVPILLAEKATVAEYALSSEKMNTEYGVSGKSFFKKVEEFGLGFLKDYRKKSSVDAFRSLFQSLSEDAVCLSIGGGPRRAHPQLTNLNVGPFPNVDIVADAHFLPYASDSVDVIYCEAVLEHLNNPVRAVEEMYRVMKKGGRAFVATPFLQAYHGYPHHYQNYTLQGHQLLFSDRGFSTIDSGVCVGPIYTMFNMTSKFIKYYLPAIIGFPLQVIVNLASLMIRPLDLVLNVRENAHFLASTTYVLVEK